MAVGYLNSDSIAVDVCGTTDLTLSFTPSAGSNRVIVVSVIWELDSPARDVSSVTIGGTSLGSRVTGVDNATANAFDPSHAIFVMKEADFPSFPATVLCTLEAGNNDAMMIVAAFEGVDQTTPVSDSEDATASGLAMNTDVTLTLTTAADDMGVVLFSMDAERFDPATLYDSATSIASLTTGSFSSGLTGEMGYKAATGSTLELGARHTFSGGSAAL